MRTLTDAQIKASFHIEEKDWLEWGNVIESLNGKWVRHKDNEWVFSKNDTKRNRSNHSKLR